MARTKAKIAGELRTSDFLTLASLMGVIPYAAVLESMQKCEVTTQRYRKLPIELMVYYVICMTLYAQVSMREVLRCIFEGCNKLKLWIFQSYVSWPCSKSAPMPSAQPLTNFTRTMKTPLGEKGSVVTEGWNTVDC